MIILGWKLQKMIITDAVGGPNKVKLLVASLGITASFLNSESLNGYISSNSVGNYEDWRQDKRSSNKLDYGSYMANYDTLGDSVSILTLSMTIGGTKDGVLNTQGVRLTSLVETNATARVPSRIMCVDTIYQPDALRPMISNPPITVVQPYLSCHSTVQTALVNASGIAVGNATLLASLFFTLSLAVIVMFVNKFRKARITPPKVKALMQAEADEKERQALKDALRRIERKNERFRELFEVVMRHASMPNHAKLLAAYLDEPDSGTGPLGQYPDGDSSSEGSSSWELLQRPYEAADAVIGRKTLIVSSSKSEDSYDPDSYDPAGVMGFITCDLVPRRTASSTVPNTAKQTIIGSLEKKRLARL